MKAHDRRPRSRREFRLESLEGRSLLSAGLPAHPMAAAAHVAHARHHPLPRGHHHAAQSVTVTARVTGLATQPYTLPGQFAITALNGAGTAHRYGPARLSSWFEVQRNDLYVGGATVMGGQATITTPALGTVSAVFAEGSESTDPHTGAGTLAFSGIAQAASGPYAGWRGAFTASGPLRTATGQFSLYVTVHLAPPPVAPVTT